MNSEEYREQIRKEVEEELARQKDSSEAALASAAPEPTPQDLVQTLADKSESASARRAALQALQQLAFKVPQFAAIRPAFIEALRTVIDDPDTHLREQAVETLAQEKDEYVQRRLLEGLEHKEKKLVDDQKAIQFLGYDVHAEHYPILRKLAKDSPDAGTRREAVQALAADPQSSNLLYDIYDNKSEDDEVRSASASALMSVAPEKFEERAKQAVVDESDAENVRAASLTALTYFSPEAIEKDKGFVEQVKGVEAAMAPPDAALSAASDEDASPLAKAVRKFRARYDK
jgi:HEAT repeat protein